MGRRGGKKFGNTPSGSQSSISVKSVLRHDHLKNLALSFSAGDAPIPSIAAFFGRSLASDGETAGIAPDPEMFSCQRCETILQPGFNCTVRIEKTPGKKHVRRKKSNAGLTQNNVIYNCLFCSHRNSRRGTAKGHMKEIYPPKPKVPPPRRITRKDIPQESCAHKENDAANPSNASSSPERTGKDKTEISDVNTPRPMLTLERGQRKRKPKNDPETVSTAMTGPEKTVGGSTKSKRRRKTWTTLKEIAGQQKSSTAIDLKKIPFLL
ncbi:PREDICTED: uncharacterized protein LOC104809392 [Tarenaya hassleriana]|uniref:uncharacterized protein LOC104809392 n=1 Tax=Tarenaya hassleriana TaxID=28532 RepID=UPI00053C8807|nr:PREDICTED: uncharacterized protein LOC104809392 [Tarenaya hassleriana]XP_010533667.1 PREDICTED: uncharacterized protein LOC104809392 [Tarenaya hassleriana]